MKHLPNLLTLGNLFFGCVAISFILDAPSFLTTMDGESFEPRFGMTQLYWGSIFIVLAAICDVFDGLTARLLHATSPIGKDLDSLADVVSFGVAPAMILYKMLWFSYMAEPGALDTNIWVTAPAFLIPCFGALRLARYNQTAGEQKQYFLGMPIPAVGLVVASFPLMNWFPSRVDWSFLLGSRWLIYGTIVLCCWLMVSKQKFLKWKASRAGIAGWWPQIILALTLIIGFFFLRFAIIPFVFILYLILSFIYPYPKVETVN